jgi:hypothetical protein
MFRTKIGRRRPTRQAYINIHVSKFIYLTPRVQILWLVEKNLLVGILVIFHQIIGYCFNYKIPSR